MSMVRRLQEKKDIEDFVWIATNAYCGFGSLEEISKRYREFFPEIANEFQGDDLFGVFRDEKLIGGMRLTDFNMKLLSANAPVGGIGCVAVDLAHKKEKTAKEMIGYACNYFKEKGMSMVTLYPFRADFYKNMGFGYGVELRQYKIEPKYFPKGPSKENVVFLFEDDKEGIIECYNKFLEKHNGMMEKTKPCVRNLFRNNRRIIGYKKDDKILGYINFSFNTKYVFKNDIVIHEFIYESYEVLLELCTFLHSQGDQFDRIIVNTTDEYFHYLASNAANGEYDAFNSTENEFCVSATGLMYRILDVKRLFEALSTHNFNNQSCKLKLNIIDDFFKPNHGSIIIHFKEGISAICHNEDYEAQVTLKVSDFSSMIMGAINFKTLVEYGLAQISDDEYIDIVNNIFAVDKKPMCITYF